MQVLSGLLGPIPGRYSMELGDLIRAMLAPEPKERPTLDEILELPAVGGKWGPGGWGRVWRRGARLGACGVQQGGPVLCVGEGQGIGNSRASRSLTGGLQCEPCAG